MRGLAGADDEDSLVSQRREQLPQTNVSLKIERALQTHLDDGDAGIGHRELQGDKGPVVKAAVCLTARHPC